MIWLSHPTGNTFVRALLRGLVSSVQPFQFHTTFGFSEQAAWLKTLPASWRARLARRGYPVPAAACRAYPAREFSRLLLTRMSSPATVERRFRHFAPRAVYRQLDNKVAQALRKSGQAIEALHAYEDGALESFRAAAEGETRRCYHLPIAYWETSRRLLQEEAQRWPEWIPTLGDCLTDEDVTEQKATELELATEVFCPSEFVLRSLPETTRLTKRCLVVPFGSPSRILELNPRTENAKRPLRVLFVGSFTQRKGLADLLAAMRTLKRPDVELILAGTPILPLAFYRQQYPNFRYEPSRSHPALLELMRGCDLLVLPSLVEGRALVQQEALSSGLPLLITPNTGGEDLIEPGTGFLVPIRQPDSIAERIDWLADHRHELPAMREQAYAKAAQYSWEQYAVNILARAESKSVAEVQR